MWLWRDYIMIYGICLVYTNRSAVQFYLEVPDSFTKKILIIKIAKVWCLLYKDWCHIDVYGATQNDLHCQFILNFFLSRLQCYLFDYVIFKLIDIKSCNGVSKCLCILELMLLFQLTFQVQLWSYSLSYSVIWFFMPLFEFV